MQMLPLAEQHRGGQAGGPRAWIRGDAGSCILPVVDNVCNVVAGRTRFPRVRQEQRHLPVNLWEKIWKGQSILWCDYCIRPLEGSVV